MTARNMRIKVNVTDLIERIEQVRDSADAEYDKAVAKYEKDNEAFQRKIRISLEGVLGRHDDNDEPFMFSRNYHHGKHHVCIVLPMTADAPSKPSKPNPTQANQDIALLKMSADDVLSISTDDRYARYL